MKIGIIGLPNSGKTTVFNALTGERTRAPIKPAGFDYRGANLAAARGRLIIATHESLLALGQSTTNE